MCVLSPWLGVFIHVSLTILFFQLLLNSLQIREHGYKFIRKSYSVRIKTAFCQLEFSARHSAKSPGLKMWIDHEHQEIILKVSLGR